MREIQITTTIQELSHIDEFTAVELQVVQEAQQAAQNAYAPYSNFSVGAAVLLENGEIIRGNNQENAAYPSGMCAERVALFYAGAQYPNVAPVSLAIAAMTEGELLPNPVPPCAACRQVMLEVESRYKKPFQLILFGSERSYLIKQAGDLVPLKFDDNYLT